MYGDPKRVHVWRTAHPRYADRLAAMSHHLRSNAHLYAVASLRLV